MAHHVQGIHYSDEAFNVVKGGFPSYSRKQSHPAVIWALNQLELWILWNAGFFPLNEWVKPRMYVLKFFLSKKHSILPKYIKPAPRSSSSCWGAPLYPTPIVTNLSTPRPPIVTNLSTPRPPLVTSPPSTYQPHAHRHQPVYPSPIVTNLSTPCPSSTTDQTCTLKQRLTRTVSKPSLTVWKISTATRIFKTLPPTPLPNLKVITNISSKSFPLDFI